MPGQEQDKVNCALLFSQAGWALLAPLRTVTFLPRSVSVFVMFVSLLERDHSLVTNIGIGHIAR